MTAVLDDKVPILNRSERIDALVARDCLDGIIRCFYCPKVLARDKVTLDHFVPLAAGGTWDLENLRIACRRCNNEKADRVPVDGIVPPPPRRQVRRAVKRSHRPDQCDSCYTGRMLDLGQVCPDCGREALPPNRSHVNKRLPDVCDHTTTWCWVCTIGFDLTAC